MARCRFAGVTCSSSSAMRNPCLRLPDLEADDDQQVLLTLTPTPPGDKAYVLLGPEEVDLISIDGVCGNNVLEAVEAGADALDVPLLAAFVEPVLPAFGSVARLLEGRAAFEVELNRDLTAAAIVAAHAGLDRCVGQ